MGCFQLFTTRPLRKNDASGKRRLSALSRCHADLWMAAQGTPDDPYSGSTPFKKRLSESRNIWLLQGNNMESHAFFGSAPIQDLSGNKSNRKPLIVGCAWVCLGHFENLENQSVLRGQHVKAEQDFISGLPLQESPKLL